MIVRTSLPLAALAVVVCFGGPALAGGAAVGGNPEGQGSSVPVTQAETPISGGTILAAISAVAPTVTSGGAGGGTSAQVEQAANTLAAAVNGDAPPETVDAALTGLLDVTVNTGVPLVLTAPAGQTPQQAFAQIQVAIGQLAAVLGLPTTAPSIQTLIAVAQQALGA